MSDTDLLAFGPDQVSALTGLSRHQLRYWEQTGFFVPDHSTGARVAKAYSFRDLVGLYTIARLRKDHRLSLQELRPIGDYLRRHHDTPWASLALYWQPGTRNLAFREPEAPQLFVGIRPPGQEVIAVEMERLAADVRARIREFRRRRPEQLGRVQQLRRVVRNEPVLAGTRVPTAAVWSFHQAGYTIDQILREYPTLTPQDIEAAINYEASRPQQRKKKAVS